MNHPNTEQEVSDRMCNDCIPEAFLPADEALIREAAKNARKPFAVLEAEQN